MWDTPREGHQGPGTVVSHLLGEESRLPKLWAGQASLCRSRCRLSLGRGSSVPRSSEGIIQDSPAEGQSAVTVLPGGTCVAPTAPSVSSSIHHFPALYHEL